MYTDTINYVDRDSRIEHDDKNIFKNKIRQSIYRVSKNQISLFLTKPIWQRFPEMKSYDEFLQYKAKNKYNFAYYTVGNLFRNNGEQNKYFPLTYCPRVFAFFKFRLCMTRSTSNAEASRQNNSISQISDLNTLAVNDDNSRKMLEFSTISYWF